MLENIKTVVIIILLLLLAGLGYWTLSQNPQAVEQLLVRLELQESEPERLTASGFIEATQVAILPQVTGRLLHLPVEEGDPVEPGQLLAEIETDLLEARIAEAEAAVAVAQAHLDLVLAGIRAEEIDIAQAAVEVAQARRDGAYQRWQDALRLRNNPQELDLEIAQAQTALDVNQQQIDRQVDLKDAAELMDKLRERQTRDLESGFDFKIEIPDDPQAAGDIPDNVELLEELAGAEPGDEIDAHYEYREGAKRAAWAQWNQATTEYWQAWVALNSATAAYESSQQNLENLQTERRNPQQRQLQVAQSESAYRQAEAAIDTAQANLALLEAGATEEEIRVARSSLAEAQAALDELQTERRNYSLHAPTGGVVLTRPAQPGEVIRPGMSLLTLGDLDPLELEVFIPEPDVDRVSLGQPVTVSVDTFPDQSFSGTVIWIADEAEYTPGNIQTAEERATTVFGVKIELPNPERKLKAGMPADALFGATTEDGEQVIKRQEWKQ